MLIPVIIPKWGLSMEDGTIAHWYKAAGDVVREGEDLVDIETEKIANAVAAPANGILRRLIVDRGSRMRVGALIAIIADESVPDTEIDSYIAEFETRFGSVPEVESAAPGLSFSMVQTRLGSLRVGRIGGQKNPVIFLHGFASDMNNWSFNLEAIKDRASVAIDLPGHGASTKDVGDGTIAALAGATSEVLTTLDIRRFDLVGHSLGAAVALELAAAMPGCAGKLVLIAPPGVGGTVVSRRFLDGLISARRVRELRATLEMLVADPSRITQQMIDGLVKFKRIDGVANALNKLRDQIVNGSQPGRLPTLVEQFKPLIIVGEKDRIVGRLNAAELPDVVTLRTIADAGHMPHVEKPEQVNDLLRLELGQAGGT